MSCAAIGIDLTGIKDSVNALDIEGRFLSRSSNIVIPPLVITGAKHFDQPLVGESALSAIEGRGWAWPAEASPPKGEFCRRIPVLSMLNKLSHKIGSLQIDGNPGDAKISKLMGHHLKYLCNTAISHAELGNNSLKAATVPDDWDETVQELMLECIRESRLSGFDLLWRPVALTLAWGEHLDSESIRNISGTALVVGFGPSTMEASILWLEHRESAEGYLLTPIRRQAGKSFASNVAKFAKQCAADIAKLYNSDTLAWQTLWGSDYLWGQLLNCKPGLKIFQTDEGEWIHLDEDYQPPRLHIWNMLKDDLVAALRMLDPFQILNADSIIASKLLEELCPVGSSLIDLFKDAFEELSYGPRFLERNELHGSMTRFSVVNPSKGAAIYAWRRMKGLPTYYDFLPQIEINAITPNGPEFIPLVPRQDTIEGGTRFGPHEVEQKFKIPGGAEEIKFYIAKENEEEVRLNITPFKEPPEKDTVVQLLVTQRPGQGHATVEIIPIDKNTSFGRGTIKTLDWKRLDQTGETKEDVLEKLKAEQKHGYPAHGPRKTGLILWESPRVRRDLLRYLNSEPTQREFIRAVGDAKKRLSSKRKLEKPENSEHRDEYIWMIGSDGETPDQELDAGQDNLLTSRFTSYAELFDHVVEKASKEFLPYIRKSKYYKAHEYSKSFKALVDLLSWCYARAPEELSDILLTAMTQKTGNGKALRAAGRCFSREKHISDLLEIVSGYYKEVHVPMYWVRSLSEIFLLRDFAPRIMTAAQATRLTLVCLNMMRREIENGKFKTRFLSATLLLMLLLRYRIKNKDFLSPTSDQWSKLRQTVDALLSFALQVIPDTPAFKKQRDYTSELVLMLDHRGCNQLIAVELGYDPELDSDKDSVDDDTPAPNLHIDKFQDLSELVNGNDAMTFSLESKGSKDKTDKLDAHPPEVYMPSVTPSQEPTVGSMTEKKRTAPMKNEQYVIRFVERLLKSHKHTKEEIRRRVLDIYGFDCEITNDQIDEISRRLGVERQRIDRKSEPTTSMTCSPSQAKLEMVSEPSVSIFSIEQYILELLKDGTYTNSQLRNMVQEKFGDLRGISYYIDDIRKRIDKEAQNKDLWRGGPLPPPSRDRVIEFAEKLFRSSDTSLASVTEAIHKEFGSYCNLSHPELRTIRNRIQKESKDILDHPEEAQHAASETDKITSYHLQGPDFPKNSPLSLCSKNYSGVYGSLSPEVATLLENLISRGIQPLEGHAILRRKFGTSYDLTHHELKKTWLKIQKEKRLGFSGETGSAGSQFLTGTSDVEPMPETEVLAVRRQTIIVADLENEPEDEISSEMIVKFVEEIFHVHDISSVEIKRLLKDKFGSKHYHLTYPQIDIIRKRIRGKKSPTSPDDNSRILPRNETSSAFYKKSGESELEQFPNTETIAKVLLKLIDEATAPVLINDLYPYLANIFGLPGTSEHSLGKSDALINMVQRVSSSLVRSGYLTKTAFGLWKITPDGRRMLSEKRNIFDKELVSQTSIMAHITLQDKVEDTKELSRVILNCMAKKVHGEFHLNDIYTSICEAIGSTPKVLQQELLSDKLKKNIQICALLLREKNFVIKSQQPGFWRITDKGLSAVGMTRFE